MDCYQKYECAINCFLVKGWELAERNEGYTKIRVEENVIVRLEFDTFV